MSSTFSGQVTTAGKKSIVSSSNLSEGGRSNVVRLAVWTNDRKIPFLICSVGMIVMLLWAGSYKMTAPGAEGIVPWCLTVR